MSVVCVKVFDDKIVFASDSIMLRGYTKSTTEFAKLAEINDMIIGGVGSAEEINLLFLYSQTHKPFAEDEKSVSEFIFDFYKWKRDLNLNFSSENEYIFAYKDKCYYISNMFVKEITTYQAIGAGMDYALAALYCGLTPEKAVITACNLCCYVAEPVITVTRKKNNGSN